MQSIWSSWERLISVYYSYDDHLVVSIQVTELIRSLLPQITAETNHTWRWLENKLIKLPNSMSSKRNTYSLWLVQVWIHNKLTDHVLRCYSDQLSSHSIEDFDTYPEAYTQQDTSQRTYNTWYHQSHRWMRLRIQRAAEKTTHSTELSVLQFHAPSTGNSSHALQVLDVHVCQYLDCQLPGQMNMW